MEEAVAINPWAGLAYLVAGVCFILALRGLSSPASSQRGNRFGMFGMLIAVGTTLITHGLGFGATTGDASASAGLSFDPVTLLEIVAAIAIGGGIGLVTARRIQ